MESCMVLVDNSEWTRNSDYAPTRFQAQADCVNLLAGAKTQANPENTVGVITMAGKAPQVLVTPTPDLGKVLNSMHDLDIDGANNLASAVQIAQLALKHRQNKNQRQRVVIFIGSPVAETKESLVKIAKKLKKNNVAVDIVSFGSEDENTEKLDAFLEAVNSGDNSHLHAAFDVNRRHHCRAGPYNDNSHLVTQIQCARFPVTVQPGMILSDSLFGTAIFQGDNATGFAAGGGGEGAPAAGGGDPYEFGVDPNLDPELALALRVSMEEERARQTAVNAASTEVAGTSGTPAANDGEAAAGVAPATAARGEDGAQPMDEDELLQQALAMSMHVDHPEPAAAAATPPGPSSTVPAAERGHDDAMMDADDELQRALAMSMQDHGSSEQPLGDSQEMLRDPEYLNSVLGSLPGVNPNDPALQSALQNLHGSHKGAEDKGKSDKKDDSK